MACCLCFCCRVSPTFIQHSSVAGEHNAMVRHKHRGTLARTRAEILDKEVVRGAEVGGDPHVTLDRDAPPPYQSSLFLCVVLIEKHGQCICLCASCSGGQHPLVKGWVELSSRPCVMFGLVWL